ncbi:MAG: LuxR C-terminal-related transcriptional regulator [Candidatus Saccharibacteria bacterium]
MSSLKKILFIDDDHLFGHTIKTVLSPRKYKIIVASTCISGIHKAFQHDPDVIFYNTNLDPLDGSEVLKALQLTSVLSHIPIIFYKDKDDEQIKNLIYNEGNGMFAKELHPNGSSVILKPADVPKRKINQEDIYDFNTLFNLSPIGMIIFDKKGILAINQMMRNLLKADKPEASSFIADDFFDKPSLRAIKQWMKDFHKDNKVVFNQQVIVKDREGESVAMNLMIAELKRVEDSFHFLGTFQAINRTNTMFNYQLAHEVCNLLKRENMEVSEALEKKITHAIKLRAIHEDSQKKSFFTRRENEVLRLSMEGLSIKVIADKLSLSTRTVEKYRTKLMLKSGAKNIVEVIVFSIKNNLLKI